MDIIFGDSYDDRPQSYDVTGSHAGTDADDPKPTVRSAIRSTRVVICGGGPAGLFLAVTLHSLGFTHVTVLERNRSTAASSYDTGRSYVFALNPRGRAVVQTVSPELYGALREYTPVPDGYDTCMVRANGAVRLMAVTDMLKNFKPGMLFYRPVLMGAMQEFCETLDGGDGGRVGIDIKYGARVTHVDMQGGKVLYETVGEEEKEEDNNKNQKEQIEQVEIEADVIMACDGSNSNVWKSLVNDKHITSKHGFDRRTWTSDAVGNKCKSVVISFDLFSALHRQDKVPKTLAQTHWTQISGHYFNMSILPMLASTNERHGGLLATVALPPSHDLWTITDLSKMRAYFDENFKDAVPNLSRYITDEAMRDFIDAHESTFALISQAPSLCVHATSTNATDKKTCCIVLGDAAHSVPPDMGQGLNASLEDVAVLRQSILSVNDDDGDGDYWVKVGEHFQQARLDDIKGLCELCSFAGRTKKQSHLRRWIEARDRSLREWGAEWLPDGVVYPPVFAMVSKQWPYAVVRRRQWVTTVRLIVGVSVVAAVIAWVFVMLFSMLRR